MKNKKEDILGNLLFTDGKEKTPKSDVITKKPTTKKSTSQKPKKTPINKKTYSSKDLEGKSSDELTKICLELKIPVVRRKVEMIKNILNNK
mgnify:FL=1